MRGVGHLSAWISVRSCLCPARPHTPASLRCCAHTPPAAQPVTQGLRGQVYQLLGSWAA